VGEMSETAPERVSWPERWLGGQGRGLALVVVQFALLVWVFNKYELENAPARLLMLIALGGFLVQLALPLSWRRWFFVALSIASVGTVLSAVAAAWVAGIGLFLIGLCHLPLPFKVRVGLVVATAGVLAAMRGDWLSAPFPGAIWMVLASFFMFRMIAYLYDLQHQETTDASQTLSYFFLLPNVCFPLFPVVDFRTFRDSYHSRPALEIYQQGIHWMVRGAVHLVLFRVVYHYFVLGPDEVNNLGQLVQFLLSNILLYLRVSGQFHLIVGMIKMFGWDLPETNHLYFLASSFNEYWRRINIYWKNFMTKVLYLPTYMALAGRGVGQTAAVAISTVAVFMISWQLHSYQWFWLQGNYPLRTVDALFWGTVGVLVLINTLREVNRRQRRFIAGHSLSAREVLVKSL
jgi:D-alanyl-lipoteichoic acid acyltransferase DltB (MBOAT superfamily)